MDGRSPSENRPRSIVALDVAEYLEFPSLLEEGRAKEAVNIDKSLPSIPSTDEINAMPPVRAFNCSDSLLSKALDRHIRKPIEVVERADCVNGGQRLSQTLPLAIEGAAVERVGVLVKV